MAKYKDITGLKFNRLTVIKYVTSNWQYGAIWLCVCECGNEKEVSRKFLVSGGTKSCGCSRIEWARSGNSCRTHGATCNYEKSNAYKSWINMRRRCYDKNFKDYERYGGQGIKVCDEWMRDFQLFLNYMGERADDLTIDRINPFGHYEPGNVRWATRQEQQETTRANASFTMVSKSGA